MSIQNEKIKIYQDLFIYILYIIIIFSFQFSFPFFYTHVINAILLDNEELYDNKHDFKICNLRILKIKGDIQIWIIINFRPK